jgi:hypothetical protein
MKFITVFTRKSHMILYRARRIQSTPIQVISLRAILILYSHLLRGLPSGIFPSDFPTRISLVYECLNISFPHVCVV